MLRNFASNSLALALVFRGRHLTSVPLSSLTLSLDTNLAFVRSLRLLAFVESVASDWLSGARNLLRIEAYSYVLRG